MVEIGGAIQKPATNATVSLPELEIFVDLQNFIDWDAELARLEKEKSRTEGLITGKEKKLSNANFVDRAPADVVKKERESLEQLKEQLKTISEAIEKLIASRPEN